MKLPYATVKAFYSSVLQNPPVSAQDRLTSWMMNLHELFKLAISLPIIFFAQD